MSVRPWVGCFSSFIHENQYICSKFGIGIRHEAHKIVQVSKLIDNGISQCQDMKVVGQKLARNF